MKKEVTYCSKCGDGWSDHDFCLGYCCHTPLSTRLETDEEEAAREEAIAHIIKRAKELGW